MEKLILVGGFGFIGMNLIKELYGEYEISIIDRNINKDIMSEYKNIKFYKFDFENDNGLNEIIEKIQPSYIMNLVSIVTAERDIRFIDKMIKANTSVLLDLYQASKKLKTLKIFLQFGSGEEYGNSDAPFNENTREVPNSPYGLCKQLTTNTAVMLYKNYGFPISVVRPSNVYGDLQQSDKFIPYIVNKLINDETIITTYGEQRRDFIYSQKFSEGIKMFLNNYENFLGEIFNLSSGESISLREVILFCKEYINSDSKILFGEIPYRENEIMNFVLDNSKFIDKIKSDFSDDIFIGLIKYINFIKQKKA